MGAPWCRGWPAASVLSNNLPPAPVVSVRAACSEPHEIPSMPSPHPKVFLTQVRRWGVCLLPGWHELPSSTSLCLVLMGTIHSVAIVGDGRGKVIKGKIGIPCASPLYNSNEFRTSQLGQNTRWPVLPVQGRAWERRRAPKPAWDAWCHY